MKKLSTLLYALFFFIITSNAQNYQWAKNMGGTDLDAGFSIALDGSGNVYSTGIFVGTADFDPGSGTSNLTSAGSNDIFISKLDAAGNFIWAKSVGGTNLDESSSISVDGSGNAYITGYFQGNADFDPGADTSELTSAGGQDIFILKLDPAGDFSWAKSIGGTGVDVGFSIAVDGSGNVYTTGYFQGIVDFDPGSDTINLTSAGSTEIFISKLDPSGNFVWAKSINGTGFDLGNSIAVDGSGNVYATGNFQGTADFDPGTGISNLTSAGADDIFILKLDPAGNFGWAKSMGGPDADFSYSIAVDGSGNLYTTGIFQGTADFDPGGGTSNLTSAGDLDIFISKLDSAGNFGWAKSIGDIGEDRGYSIAVDDSGYVYTTGWFTGSADFDPGAGTSTLTSAGSQDVFISKLDAAGNFGWANRIGDIDLDRGYSIVVDGSGNVYTTGLFTGTADFDPGAGTVNITSVGSADIFISKLGPASVGFLENSFGNTLRVYPNPGNGTLSIDLGTTYDDVNVNIRNLLGQDILKKSFTGSEILQVNIPGGSGMYFIELSSANKKAILKVVKE